MSITLVLIKCEFKTGTNSYIPGLLFNMPWQYEIMTWQKVVGVKALDNAGGHLSAKVGDNIIFFTKDEAGLQAMNAVCSHAKCILGEYDAAKKEVKCPCHHAVFNLENGNMIVPPSVAPNSPMDKLGLKKFNVRENQGFIEVEI